MSLNVADVSPPPEQTATAERDSGPHHATSPWVRRVGAHLGVIALFTLPAVVLWWNAWSGGAASTVRCSCLDPGQSVWFIAWPAYALAHGLNPLFSTWLWQPHGVNLLLNASSPLTGIVLSPFTWAFGPIASTTLGLTLAPGLSAWGCWVACRRFVSWQPACWIAGFLFGYSSFIVDSVAQGHLSAGLLVVPPLVVVVLHETLVRQQRSSTWCGVTLGLLLLAQFLIAPDNLAIMVLIGAIGVAIAAIVNPHRLGSQLRFALRAFGIAALTSVVLLAAPIWYLLDGPQRVRGSYWSGAQIYFNARGYGLWNSGDVRSVLWPGGLQGPQPQYVGFVVLVIAFACLVVARRRAAWVMAAVAIVCTALSWGLFLWLSPTYVVSGKWLPWYWLANWPVLVNISTSHFAAFADLALALVVAMGLNGLRTWRLWARLPRIALPIVLVGIAAALFLPTWSLFQAPFSVQPVGLPPWFATAALHVPEGSVVVTYPFPASASLTSEPMVWQSADDMRFRLAGGYVKVPGPGQGVIGTGRPGSAVRTLVDLTSPPGGAPPTTFTPRQLESVRSAVRSWRTSYIVVTNSGFAPVEAAALFTAATGIVPQLSHRSWVWDLRTTPLPARFDASSAASAFATCPMPKSGIGAVPSGRPLPQGLNTCVAAAASR
jgi:hypothetical protein